MSNLLKVLLVENDASNTEIFERLLSNSTQFIFEVECVDTIAEAVVALTASHRDVLLLGISLREPPICDGTTGIEAINANVPIVIVTDQNDGMVAMRALQNGVQDHLPMESLTTDSLIRSIQYAIERHKLVAHLAESRVILENKNRRLAKLYRTAHEFVDNASHEFRTPLTVIKEYVSLIKDGIVGSVSDEQRQMLTVVEDRADDLNTMVDDMLDVSKLEAGLLGVYRKQCTTAEILAHVRPALERKALTRSVELEWDIDADIPPVYCDCEKAGRVIVNLMTNAIKFCGQPGHVRLSCCRSLNLPGVKISVTDNGPGISVENQRRLFRRFRQLSGSVRSSTKGFGLGLSIAKQLVEANLGEIRVISEPGQGSTFSFTLPPADYFEVMRRYLHRIRKLRNGLTHLSLVQVDVAKGTHDKLAEDIDGFLSCLLRYNDLLVRVTPSEWVIVLPVLESEVQKFRQRAEKALDETERNRLGQPFPKIDFQFLGTWGVDCGEDILARLRSVNATEEVVYV